MLDTGYWILDAGCWMMDAGSWILDAGCWMMDAGYWMMDAGCGFRVSGNNVSTDGAIFKNENEPMKDCLMLNQHFFRVTEI